jgi:hypothetical protein
MEGAGAMKDERESNPSFLGTRLAVMAAILAVGIAALAATTCHNPVALSRQAAGATWRLMSTYDAAREEADIIANRARGWGADAVTDASVMWGSFAPATCGERACEAAALPAPGVGARGKSSGRG